MATGSDLDHDQFGAVVQTGDPGHLAIQTPADNHACPVKVISPAGVTRKDALMRGVDTVDQPRHDPLSTMRVPTDDQVKSVIQIAVDPLRPMRDQNRVPLALLVPRHSLKLLINGGWV